ncbi:YceH family protein [Tautonia plasticadhaerens]|uniref:DUF480 domain-containing protein n=1 Tax=Tautonia plasticadhaerens TaxID=2527974 RepID=A0A518GWE9_9BACT|nr:DUF480 domain-containing protein [Tautonia plasticadhaerens]QDV32917.1 hypothetical protein ElP_07590 [Tautonia plasticadhaerens]
MSEGIAERRWGPLSARERRVLGVLVEKQKTTPDAYPMSISALVTGSNQKSNRDPVSSYDADDVEQTLISLRKKGAAIQVEGSGRVEKWKHNLYEWLDLKGQAVAMAVLAELLLRGPQTVGELRGRAARMVSAKESQIREGKPNTLRDLDELQEVLDFLAARDLVVVLSPPGQKRGVVVTHGLCPPEELERERQEVLHAGPPAEDEPRSPRPSPPRGEGPPGWAAEVAALRDEVETLRSSLEALSAEVRTLKESLGS